MTTIIFHYDHYIITSKHYSPLTLTIYQHQILKEVRLHVWGRSQRHVRSASAATSWGPDASSRSSKVDTCVHVTHSSWTWRRDIWLSREHKQAMVTLWNNHYITISLVGWTWRIFTEEEIITWFNASWHLDGTIMYGHWPRGAEVRREHQ